MVFVAVVLASIFLSNAISDNANWQLDSPVGRLEPEEENDADSEGEALQAESEPDLRTQESSESEPALLETESEESEPDLRETESAESEPVLHKTKSAESAAVLLETESEESEPEMRKTESAESEPDLRKTESAESEPVLLETESASESEAESAEHQHGGQVALEIAASGNLVRSEFEHQQARRDLPTRTEVTRMTTAEQVDISGYARRVMESILQGSKRKAEMSAAAVVGIPAFLLLVLLHATYAVLCGLRESYVKSPDDFTQPLSCCSKLTTVLAAVARLTVMVPLIVALIGWLFVVPGPFLQRFMCMDSMTTDAPSSDVTPMVREAMRGYCWEGYRWGGLPRREAELLLRGLERSLEVSPAGDVVEFGAGLGETSILISRFLDIRAKMSNGDRPVHRVYDAFSGGDFPKRDRFECDDGQGYFSCQQGLFQRRLLQWIMENVIDDRKQLFTAYLKSQGATMPKVHKDELRDIPGPYLPKEVSFAVFDSDTYRSTMQSLKIISPRLAGHGQVYVHNYRNGCCSGVGTAMLNFFKVHDLKGVFRWGGQGPHFISWAIFGPSLSGDDVTSQDLEVAGWKWTPTRRAASDSDKTAPEDLDDSPE